MVLVVEDDHIVLDESVADNILLAIPIKVLTPEEEAGQELPSGQAWALMTEEDFQQKLKRKKKPIVLLPNYKGYLEMRTNSDWQDS